MQRYARPQLDNMTVSNSLTVHPFQLLPPLNLIAFVLLLASCASTQVTPPPEPAVAKIEALPATKVVNSDNFDNDELYSLLVAELALARERYDLGLENYLEQARKSKDLNVTARTTRIARILNRHEEALEMAEQWREIDPGSREARFILVSEYVRAERFNEAFSEAQTLLKAGHTAGFEDIAYDASQKKSAELPYLRDEYANLLVHYPDNVELLVGSSVLLQESHQLAEALVQAEKAASLRPDSTRAIYQHYRVLDELNRDEEATAVYSQLLDIQPENFRVRSRYASMLINIDLKAALEQYEILAQQAPQNQDVLLNLGLLQLDQKHYESATASFESLIERNQHISMAQYGLGEIASADDDYVKALAHYTQVKDGGRYVDAATKAANIINELESFENALVYLQSRRESANEEDRESLFLVEADTLLDAGLSARAQAAYHQGLKEYPDSIKLLYSRAMFYAMENNTDAAELDFKQVLELSPNNPATLNALGYTLVDQTDRVEEARIYIEKAYALQPDDPAILDSMGWMYFKLGDRIKALSFLAAALDQLMDDEIAAHYGEVLWLEGQKRKARKIWNKGLEHEPESAIIRSTLDRLGVEGL